MTTKNDYDSIKERTQDPLGNIPALKDEDGNLLRNVDKKTALRKKYVEMAGTRDDFNNIDPDNFLTPNMNEMVEEDLMEEIYQQYIENDPNLDLKEADEARLNAAYYKETPFETTPGYYQEQGAFVLRAKSHCASKDLNFILNKYDGDTTSFDLETIEDGGEDFSFNNGNSTIIYKGFKDYFKKLNGSTSLSVRHLGIDAAEIPHYEIQCVLKDNKEQSNKNITLKNVVELKYKDFKNTYLNNSKYIIYYEKYPVNNLYEIQERKDEDTIKLLRVAKENDVEKFVEIKNIEVKDSWITKKDEYEYFVVVQQKDESIKNTVVDGYNARNLVRNKLQEAKDIILILNANGISVDRTVTYTGKTFNSIYYLDNVIKYLIDEWDVHFQDLPETNYGYSPYGADTYGRSLGVIYIKDSSGEWINLNKYVLANTKYTKANPQFNDSPELQAIGAGVSDSFNLWSYDKNNIEWMDSFTRISAKSYEERLELHKQLTGIDFLQVRDCALMLGDTLFLVPPESIRNVQQVSYERLPNLRSKGTMAKHMGNRENMLEINLYFYEEQGINGIPYQYTAPNGTVLNYKMNGLRSLIAQFKIAPFLPIENGYINDVLGIEAVALNNLSIQTVEGFPRLLKAVLTLKEFNYRVFMPDMPVDDDMENSDQQRLSKLQPMFAKSFNWELFRYYYQRAIIAGEKLSDLEFASYDYNLMYYGNKNTVSPWIFCGPKSNKGEVSFYIPREDWLANALQVKKQREQYPLTNNAGVELSGEAKKYCTKLSSLSEKINKIRDYTSIEGQPFRQAVNNLFTNYADTETKIQVFVPPLLNEEVYNENIGLGGMSSIRIKNIEQNFHYTQEQVKKDFIEPLVYAMIDTLNDPDTVHSIRLDERVNTNKLTNLLEVTWEFRIKLNISSLSADDWTAIKEILAKDIDKKPKDIFKDDYININYKMIFNNGETKTVYSDLVKTTDFITAQDGYPNTFRPDYSDDELCLKGITSVSTDDTELDNSYDNEFNEEIDFYVKDYKNPANMPFDPYIEGVLCKSMGTNIANNFTEVSIKAIEGKGPQYLGGQDTQIELEMITDDIMVVSALNTLPTLASAMAKKYRRILPAWPIKIKSDLTNLLGVSEVLIDMMEIDTVAGFPGVYSIVMRMTSVDRTQRQREALRRLDVKPQGGKVDYNGNSNLSLKNYFAIDKCLSEAELYPDLDLPTLEELAKLGYRFVKYANKVRSYPDPDFYISYAYPYTSLIIKKMVKDVISQQILNKDGKEELQSFKFRDVMGAELTAKVEAYTGLSVTSLDNDEAKTYDEIVAGLEQKIADKLINNKSLNDNEKEDIEDRLGTIAAVKKIVMSDVTSGWEIKPGWQATLAEHNTEKAIREYVINGKKNAYAQEVYKLRKKAVKLIDEILSEPLQIRPYDGTMQDEQYKFDCENAVKNMFVSSQKGYELISLLCPGMQIQNPALSTDIIFERNFGKSYFKSPDPLKYIAGYLFASGCALSGWKEYRNKIPKKDWYPNHYVASSSTIDKCRDKGNKYEGMQMPYCVVNRIEGSSKLTTTIEDAVANGNTFGAWRIVKYADIEALTNMVQSESSINYTDKSKDNLYNNTIRPNFIDPYYNGYDENSKTLNSYKETILLNKQSNAEAFLRNMLVFLRKMIVDGLLISEIDIIAHDFNELYQEITDVTGQPTQGTGYSPGQPSSGIGSDNSYAPGQQIYNKNKIKSALTELGYDETEIVTMMNSIKQSIQKSLCARLIYPFIMATIKGNRDVYTLIKNRDYSALNSLTGYVEDSSSIAESRSLVLKFLSAMSGIHLSLTKNGENEAYVGESQKLMNSLLKDVFIQASEDPRAYILHSFYDMLVNDKRGRLVRAFPTYYVVFVDEGRKIGSWKLHDNFYNMSSVASINVVKSRKIAADTCTIVMNNMFNSYAQEPDATTTQQYADIYGMRDVFDSIFSPKTYFDKEKRIRLRQQLPDTVALQPGIRIHVRMGYSADGSKLPIVFNGKVAEVSVEEICQIVAQGDGHELMNPLNAFGQAEVTDLDPAQSYLTWFRDFRGSLAKGGESPRELIAKLLIARYGGWKKTINYTFDGRWFNENPFGITHFGDKKFNQIFEQGEVVQNLYEVCDATLLKGINEFGTQEVNKKMTPTINTSLEDKTFWDLLHLAANTGINYIGAIRDFGFRSTIFLGKPNHYYAYGYEIVDDKIVERRKPFQQFHYYDSYTDIVYNSIKASESQMKTNAVGLWQSSSMLWGREQATVGPIYLDMNIYPEYQKSMTVDTQLLADGDGGIDVGFINHFSEKWSTTPNDNKVNKSTAERVTANALKDSVKDMYLGDLCVLGDPSVKPYDRIYLHDTYEDMKGMFEVEAVIHNMSIETGFTTSVMPDVIARHGDDFESSVQSLTSPIFATIGFTTSGLILDKLWGAAVHNKLATVITKSDNLWRGASKINTIGKDLANATGFKDFLDSKPGAKAFFDKLNVFPKQTNLDLNAIDKAIDVLSDIDLGSSKVLAWDDIGRVLVEYSKLDADKYKDNIAQALKDDKYGIVKDMDNDAIDNLIKEMQDAKIALDKNIDIKKLNLQEFADEIYKLNDASLELSSKQILTKWAAGQVNEATLLDDLGRVLQEEDIIKALKSGNLKVTNVDDFVKDFSKIFSKVDGTNLTLFASLSAKLKGGDLLDSLKVIIKGGLKLNWVTLAIDLAIETFVFVFTKNTQELFTRFLQNIQAIDVYPLKKNNRPLIAGMNGHKGAVYGWPVIDGYNSIQGMIMEFTDSVKAMLGGNIGWLKWFSDAVVDMFVDTNTLESLSKEWKNKLGIEETETVNQEEMLQEVYSNISSMYAANNQAAYSLMTKPRMRATDKSSKALELYNFYKITGLSPLLIANNEKIQNLLYVMNESSIREAMIDGRFVISHSDKPTYIISIPFESGTEDIPIKIDGTIIDVPLIQEEGMYIISNLLNDERVKDTKTKIYFKSGTKINDTAGWRSTGYRFILEVKGQMNNVEAVLKDLKENTNILKEEIGIFDYTIKDSKVEIKINPVVQTVVKGAY